eukprot:3940590-Rhodomonas_salina.2
MGNTCSQEDEMDALGMDCFCKVRSSRRRYSDSASLLFGALLGWQRRTSHPQNLFCPCRVM